LQTNRKSKKLNLIDGGTAIEEYAYSSQGRLLSVIFKQVDQTTNVTTTIKTINYKHNALGNRVAKLVDGSVVEKYLWLDKTTLLAIYDQNDNLKQRFEYGLGHTPVKFTQNSTAYYITSDHLGSPRTITDESGSVIKAIEYDSFGNVVSDSNSAFEIPFGFAGGLKDSDTSLLRFGYRDYDPQIGRWTARDPIGFAGGDTYLYGYVASDPVNFVDFNGMIASEVSLAGPVIMTVGGGLVLIIGGPVWGATGFVLVVVGGAISFADWMTGVDENMKQVEPKLNEIEKYMQEQKRLRDELNGKNCE
jgi:RHS repeat-associated protein